MTWDLGRRLRETRLRLGLTQQEVAAGIVSAAFLSMVESGRREPSSEVLAQLVDRLGLDPDMLRDSGGSATLMAIRAGLVRAEVLVESGDFASALAEVDAIDRLFAGMDEADLRAAFHYWRGRALEGLARTDSAVRELLVAVETAHDRGDLLRELEWGIDLARCLRIRGDLSAALDRVQQLQAALPAALEGSALHGKLLATAIGLYVLRGDNGMARLMAERAQHVLTDDREPTARGYVLWNASLAAEANGDAAGALALASEATRVLRDGADLALRARLATAVAFLHTRVLPPDLDAAEEALRLARAAFGRNIAAHDASTLAAEEARLCWLRGDFAGAVDHAHTALSVLERQPNDLLAANAHLLSARAFASLGDADRARLEFAAGRGILAGAEPSRNTAVAWRELGDVFLEAGMADDAVACYQLALTDAGLASAPADAAATTSAPSYPR